MKKSKLNLGSIQVKSFTTGLASDATIRGGSRDTTEPDFSIRLPDGQILCNITVGGYPCPGPTDGGPNDC